MKLSTAISHILFATLLICIGSLTSNAQILDLTVFGGIQDPGKLTFETAPGSATNLVQEFDPQTFGVVGARLGHGALVGGEHTLSYSPKFIDSDSYAINYHSNLRIQPTISFVKPYATAGIGVIYSGGDSLSSFGAKFAFNYGGGVTLTSGLMGFNLDLRGYAVPKVTVVGFTTQERLDFLEASAGISFHF